MKKRMIEVDGLTKRYGEQQVLQQVSFSVEEGEMLIVLGESGCGKSTLLRILAGLEKENSGSVKIQGELMSEKIPPNQRKIAMVFQEPALWNHMTVWKNITYGMKVQNRERVYHMMDILGIRELEKRYPEEISGGQAKRVALARAFAADREILLLDEPLSNIDEGTKKKILQYIAEEYVGEKTILYVTHSRMEADFFSCRRMEMEQGGRME